jgi:hypothetical protein
MNSVQIGTIDFHATHFKKKINSFLGLGPAFKAGANKNKVINLPSPMTATRTLNENFWF